MGVRAIALFDAPADRTFEPQMHADGRGWGKGRSLFLTHRLIALLNRRYTRMDADGRGWGKGRSLFLTHRPIALLNRRYTRMDADGGKGALFDERSIPYGIASLARTFEPQIHADGRGWG
ncbi:hypothetical protein QUB68_16585 [Microcoleus sp. A006_D1]|uniref:hypothetical protein n=1 Tax=Microcoleus sp. A006_D1 TaxID=3055267 RepID=UPI002FD26C9A